MLPLTWLCAMQTQTCVWGLQSTLDILSLHLTAETECMRTTIYDRHITAYLVLRMYCQRALVRGTPNLGQVLDLLYIYPGLPHT